MALALSPKLSLPTLDVHTVYEKSTSKLVSDVGPILSFITDKPKPTPLYPIGECILNVCVVGAPSKPSHCALYRPGYT